MKSDSDSGGQDHAPPNDETRSEEVAAAKEARRSDELASRLAYECGWRACEDNLRTLEGQRTRALALLSVTILATGIVASVFLGNDLLQNIGCIGVIGAVAFVLGALGVAVFAVCVAWPVTTMAALRPAKIIENYVSPQQQGRTPVWVYRYLARDLDEALQDLKSKLKIRSWLYVGSIISTMIMLVGVAILVLDVTL